MKGKARVEGIRICCSGRSKGAEIARTECGKSGKTSNVFNQNLDSAPAEVSTRYGISGVKVWISYSKKGLNNSFKGIAKTLRKQSSYAIIPTYKNHETIQHRCSNKLR